MPNIIRNNMPLGTSSFYDNGFGPQDSAKPDSYGILLYISPLSLKLYWLRGYVLLFRLALAEAP